MGNTSPSHLYALWLLSIPPLNLAHLKMDCPPSTALHPSNLALIFSQNYVNQFPYLAALLGKESISSFPPKFHHSSCMLSSSPSPFPSPFWALRFLFWEHEWFDPGSITSVGRSVLSGDNNALICKFLIGRGNAEIMQVSEYFE